jgi:hypothetical protein
VLRILRLGVVPNVDHTLLAVGQLRIKKCDAFSTLKLASHV